MRDGRTDGQTDRRTEWNQYIPQKLCCVGLNGWGISCESALIWMSLDFTDDQSTLVQVMVWCCRATSHYLSQWWPRSLSSYGVTRPEWVECVTLQPISMTDLLSASNETDLRWKPQNYANDKSVSVQVMAWCRQATSHYLNQCWPSSVSSHDVTIYGLRSRFPFVLYAVPLYNTVTFLQNTHNRQPMSHPRGRGIGCLWGSPECDLTSTLYLYSVISNIVLYWVM